MLLLLFLLLMALHSVTFLIRCLFLRLQNLAMIKTTEKQPVFDANGGIGDR